MFYLIALSVFALDLIIKSFISILLVPAMSVPVVKGLINLTYIQNTGVAFGLFPGQTTLLILIGIVVCVVVGVLYARTSEKDALLKTAFAVILGGSIGNLFDRVMHGYVIDYIDVRYFSVFNFADVAINFGVFLVLLDIFLRGKECTR